MKNSTLFLFGALFLCAASAVARLGETNVQIAHRYGPVEKRTEIGTNEWAGDYSFKEYSVRVLFTNNISECEYVQPVGARAFSDDERDALMTSISGGGEWSKDTSTFSFMSSVWINKKDQSVAYVKDEIMSSSLMAVCTHEYALRLEAKQSAKEKAKADGF